MTDSNPKPRAERSQSSRGGAHPEPVERLIDELAKLPGLFDLGVGVKIELATPSSPVAASTDSRAAKIEQARQLPLVRTATQIFNADVVDVQDSPTPSAPTPKKPGSQDDV